MGGTQLHRKEGGEDESAQAPCSSPSGVGALSRTRQLLGSHPVACVAFAVFTVLRLILSIGRDVLRHPTFVAAIGPHSPIASALVDPTLTVSHLREGHFLVHYSNSNPDMHVDGGESASVGGTLDFAYAGEPTFRLPPLVLAMFEPILSLSVPSSDNEQSIDPNDASIRLQNFVICLLLTLVDLGVAWGLYELARSTLLEGDDFQKEEEALEKIMDPRILPRRGWMFGVAPGYSDAAAKATASSGQGEDGGKDDGKNESACEKPQADAPANSGGEPSGVEDGGNDGVATSDENGCHVEGNGATEPTKDGQDVDDSSSHGGRSAETSHLLGEGDTNEADGEGATADLPSSPEPPILTLSEIPIAVATWYYCNPISAVSCSMQSLRSLLFLSYVSAMLCARRGGGDAPRAALWVALAAYVEVYPVVLLVPVTIMVGRVHGFRRSVVGCVGFFTLWSAFLYLISFLLVGRRWDVVFRCHAFNFDFRDLSPNMGMAWYLFMEMFDQFRPYFVTMLNGLPYIFVLPLTVRLHRYPLALGTSLLFLWFIFKPVLTLQDVSFALGCLLLSPRSVARMGTSSTVALMSIVVPSALYVVDYWMWMVTGSGNANYMYFQCLAFDVFAATIMLDFVAATAKRDKAIRLTRAEGQETCR